MFFIQDGFFDGELLDGRRGLVPSNYVQQLYGRDLEDFYQSMVVRLRECDDSATTTVPQNIEYMLPGLKTNFLLCFVLKINLMLFVENVKTRRTDEKTGSTRV